MECRSKNFLTECAAQQALRQLQNLIQGLNANDHLMAGCIEKTLVFCFGSDGSYFNEVVAGILPEYQMGLVSAISHPEIFPYYEMRAKQEKAAYHTALDRLVSFSDAKLDCMIKVFTYPGVLNGDYIPGILSMEDWAALALCERDRRPISVG